MTFKVFLSWVHWVTLSWAQTLSLEKLYVKKDYKTLISQYSTQLKELDRNQLYLLAQSYAKLNRYQEAYATFDYMLQKNPTDLAVLREWALLLTKQKKYKQAIEKLNEAIKADPNYELAYVTLGETILQYKPKNFMELRILYQDMVERFGAKEDYLYKVCLYATQEGQHQEAQTWCQRTLKANPQHALAKVHLGQILADQKEYEKADSYFNKILPDVTHSPEALLQIASYFEQRGQKAKAFEVLAHAKNSFKSHVEYQIRCASLACSLGFIQECYESFELACHAEPKSVLALKKVKNFVKSSNNKTWVERFYNLETHCAERSRTQNKTLEGGT